MQTDQFTAMISEFLFNPKSSCLPPLFESRLCLLFKTMILPYVFPLIESSGLMCAKLIDSING